MRGEGDDQASDRDDGGCSGSWWLTGVGLWREKTSNDCKLWREGERCASVGAKEEEWWLSALFSRDCL